MNLACPQCSTVYRIDPARVPEAGVTAQCRQCGAKIRVRREEERAGVVHTAAAVEPAAAEPPATEAPAAAPGASAPSAATGGGAARAGSPGAPASPGPTTGSGTGARPGAPVFGPQDPDTRARRLARALVSDIVVYNPEKWEQSRVAGTLRKDFREEILKSWEEYVEQVGQEMAKKTPYFRDALNEILAEGQPVF